MKINYLFVYAVAKHVKMFQPKGSGCQSTTSKGIIKSNQNHCVLLPAVGLSVKIVMDMAGLKTEKLLEVKVN